VLIPTNTDWNYKINVDENENIDYKFQDPQSRPQSDTGSMPLLLLTSRDNRRTITG